MEILPGEDLLGLSTGALLTRLKRLRWCYETPEDANDLTDNELSFVKDKILFKSDDRWKTAYRDVKAILDTREHKGNMVK